MLAKLSNLLVADAIRIAGMQDLGPVTLLPLATGMAIAVTLLALKAARPATARCAGALEPTTCTALAFSPGPAQHHLLCLPAPALLGPHHAPAVPHDLPPLAAAGGYCGPALTRNPA